MCIETRVCCVFSSDFRCDVHDFFSRLSLRNKVELLTTFIFIQGIAGHNALTGCVFLLRIFLVDLVLPAEIKNPTTISPSFHDPSDLGPTCPCSPDGFQKKPLALDDNPIHTKANHYFIAFLFDTHLAENLHHHRNFPS